MDDELFTELREALQAAQQVPPNFLAAGKAAFTWRDVDTELATITHDSVTSAETGTRADRAELRALTFVSSELTIELEVTEDALIGQVAPAQAGQIGWEGPNGRSDVVEVDDIGWFTIRPVPAGPMRLRLRTASGAVIHTEWTTL